MPMAEPRKGFRHLFFVGGVLPISINYSAIYYTPLGLYSRVRGRIPQMIHCLCLCHFSVFHIDCNRYLW